jgi:hypothetical protein
MKMSPFSSDSNRGQNCHQCVNQKGHFCENIFRTLNFRQTFQCCENFVGLCIFVTMRILVCLSYEKSE